MKVCFIGWCGHSGNAYRSLRTRADAVFVGAAPGGGGEVLSPKAAPGVPRFDDYREMLDRTAPDLAVVSPIFGLTASVSTACAARGIDVFSEKPVAGTEKELDALHDAVDRSGIRFCAMHFLRYDPAFYEGAALVRGGAIGEVKLITAQKSYVFGTRPGWYADRNLYGGTIPWVGIHAIDWIRAFTGKKFLSVTAVQSGSPEMAALCQYELEGGVHAAISLDYYRPKTAPSHGDDRVRAVGTEGVLEVRGGEVILMNADGCRTWKPAAAPDLTLEFIDGKEPLEKEEIFELTRVALRSRQAADTGKKELL